MRPAPTRTGRLAPFVLACLVALVLAPSAARAQEAERFNLAAYGGYGIERFHSLAADLAGVHAHAATNCGLLIDFRTLEVPMGKTGARPALHLTGGFESTERILGPAVEGMNVAAFEVLDFSAGAQLELPFDALVKGNPGVSLRVGWDGGYMLTRTSGSSFLERSKLRVDCVRTTGPLAGSLLGFGKGVDQVYGWDAGSGRSDVHVSLQARLIGTTPPVPPAPPVKPGTRPAPAKPAPPSQRLMWVFVDVTVDTDGGPQADGLRGRAGLGFDVSAFTTAAFASRH